MLQLRLCIKVLDVVLLEYRGVFVVLVESFTVIDEICVAHNRGGKQRIMDTHIHTHARASPAYHELS